MLGRVFRLTAEGQLIRALGPPTRRVCLICWADGPAVNAAWLSWWLKPHGNPYGPGNLHEPNQAPPMPPMQKGVAPGGTSVHVCHILKPSSATNNIVSIAVSSFNHTGIELLNRRCVK